jgi:valyl-tRNA synthetase
MKLPKVYEPNQYEEDIYALWEKSAAFEPKNRGSSGSYSIVVPPPNANGDLHIGHALTLAIEDIAVRYHRMKGEATLLLPGADHAGFETQVVYEKRLAKEGKSRFDFTRDQLYKQIWDFVAQNRENYESQFRKLGASVDWSRYTFTLDQKIVNRTYGTFKKMWDEGLIYRGTRLVNFCTFHGTSFADIEVVYKQEQGSLWFIKYPLTDGSGDITVATTRPETMLGDTAVAVHPKDTRYKQMIGKTVKLPLTHREIPVLADDFVDKNYGTGAVKITPAHDPNDFEVAGRHDLPKITVITHEGKMSHEVPEMYKNLPVKDAREKVVKDLKDQGFLAKEEELTHSVAHCYKCDTVLEPLLREQWFIDMQPLAQRTIKELEKGSITFYPDTKKKQLITYLQGLKDWNISRQIAWGIPIPAFQNIDEPDDWVYDERVSEEFIEKNGKTYRRDPDVFDTWFSSSSWPYATLDYPEGEDFHTFYPLSLMETGGEILYPWVSRMIMLGLYVTGKVPFEAVYIHGYVMAEDGSKMSKSVGNVVAPLPVIEQYGSDALRMGIVANRAPAINRGYDPAKVQGARNFANKLWNVARFTEDKIGDDAHHRADPSGKTAADEWMLSKLQHSMEQVTKHLDHYRFAEAYESVYHLLWDDFADWYIEASKGEGNASVLAYGLETILKLAHPFAPFVTETIWQTLAWEQNSLLITSAWPSPPSVNKSKADTFEQIKRIITEIRYLMTALSLEKPTLYYTHEPFVVEHAELIRRLARLESISEVKDGKGLRLTETNYDCWLDVDQNSLRAYVRELAGKIGEQEKVIAGLKKRLENKAYVDKAPKEVVNQTKDQLKAAEEQLEKLHHEQQCFSSSSTSTVSS